MSKICSSRLRPTVVSIIEMVSVIVLSTIFGAPAWADPCPGQQQAVDILRSRIKADQERIRNLGIGITASQLQDATDMGEEGRKNAMLAAALSLVNGFLMAPDAALQTQSVADYELKNGLGSIGTGQANSLIARIKAEGGAKLALIPLIGALSHISDKTSSLEYLALLAEAASALKSTAELGAADNSLEEAEALFGIAAAIAGTGDVALSLASAVVNGAENETQIYLMARDIRQLTNTAEAQLRALKVLSANLQMDVQTLQRVRTGDNCVRDLTWEIALQNQRIVAATAGNLDYYNQLLRLHAQLFAQLGFQACQSRYYPGGCSPTPGLKNQGTQGPVSSCPQFSPQTVSDALQVEHASFKDVCWEYNGDTLVAISSEAPDKSDKPYYSGSQAGAGDGTKNRHTEDDRAQGTGGNGGLAGTVSPTITQKMGKTGALVGGPRSIASMIPHMQGNNLTVSIFHAPCRTYVDHGDKGTAIKIDAGDVVESGDVGERISLKAGHYCAGVGERYGSSENGFRTVDFTVVSGKTATVTVPMGIVVLLTIGARKTTACSKFKNSEGIDIPGMLRRYGGAEPDLKPPLNRYVLPPGDYSYRCTNFAGMGNVTIPDFTGTFTVRTGEVTTQTLD